MKDNKNHWSTLTHVLAFLMGVILFWSPGNGWLYLDSPVVFLGGLVGVAAAVLAFGAWKTYNSSNHREN